jgi:phosphotriesterase-related protein
VIDVTPDGIGRDPARLAEISRATGVDIVTGCGPYIEAAWGPEIKELSENEFADRIIALFSSDVPPAVIGEIGTSSPITQRERRSLRGAAIAQSVLDAPLYVHLDPWSPQGHEALDIIETSGGNLGRVVLCHLDVTATKDIDVAVSLLDRGCYIAFDIWGDEDIYGDNAMPTDASRAAATLELVKRGFGQQILHSQDVCTKSQLASFGGAGFAHMHTVARDLLTSVGLDAGQVQDQLSRNAIRMLRA